MKRPSHTAWALFLLLPAGKPVGIFFLETTMTAIWLLGFVVVGLAIQTATDAKLAMETKGPSTPLRSARDDKAQAGKPVPQSADSLPAPVQTRAEKTEKQVPRRAGESALLGIAPSEGRAGEGAVLNMTPSEDFAHNRVVRSYVQHYKHSADRVFAVTEPVEEVKWAPGFEFEWVYAREGANAKAGQQGDVFVTRHGAHEVVWVISKRDLKERVIQFVRFLPGVETVQIDIHVTTEGGGSKAEITYTWTALSEHGRERLKKHTQEAFDREMKEWEEQVDAYLSRR
jgi:hypothetical protein